MIENEARANLCLCGACTGSKSFNKGHLTPNHQIVHLQMHLVIMPSGMQVIEVGVAIDTEDKQGGCHEPDEDFCLPDVSEALRR